MFYKNLNEGIKMTVKKIGLAWIAVSDFKKSNDFFKNVLNLDLCESNEQFGWAEFKGADAGCLLGVAKSCDQDPCDIKPGANAVVTFTVDNLDQSFTSKIWMATCFSWLRNNKRSTWIKYLKHNSQ